MLRPTQSLGMYLKQCGRVLRPSPGKIEAVILDHVGNCERHGLPDEERHWELSDYLPGNKNKGINGSSVKVCPKCFAAQYSGKPSCSFCGFEFAVNAREIAQQEGDLVEVDVEVLRKRKKREQGRSETLADLVALGRSRGYPRAELWAKHVFNARQAKKIRGD